MTHNGFILSLKMLVVPLVLGIFLVLCSLPSESQVATTTKNDLHKGKVKYNKSHYFGFAFMSFQLLCFCLEFI